MQRVLAVLAGSIVVVVAIGAVRPASAQRAAPQPSVAAPLLQVVGAESPVLLQSADVWVEAAGSLARTTLLLTLHNPNDRMVEGNLQFPLAPGQQVSGFALDVGGVLRDAVPVPKARARQVFEAIERRGVDPGLLEQVGGNAFRLRVYPIPALGTRQVRLVIDEAMRREDGAWRLDVPVHLLAGAGSFTLRVDAWGMDARPSVAGGFDELRFQASGTGHVAEVRRDAFRPGTGLALRFPAATSTQVLAASLGGEHYVVAEVHMPEADRSPRVIPSAVGVLWDASASARQRDREGEFELLDRYFHAMGNGRATLRLLRDAGEDGGEFAIRDGDWSALRRTLESAELDGASNLADWQPAAGIGEYLLFSDGRHNYGDAPFPELAAGQRLFALDSSGAVSDGGRLAALAHARGGRRIAWQGRSGLDAAARTLLSRGTRVVALGGSGVSDLQLESPNVDGGLLRIAGRLVEPTGTIHLVVDEAGGLRELDIPVSTAANPSPRAAQLWAAWRVATLSAEPGIHRAAIARLGREFGLVTSGTSLLVLDEPADYVRYDIPAPPALRDQVSALRKARAGERAISRTERLDVVAARFAERISWWDRHFPKGSPPPVSEAAKRASDTTLDSVTVVGTAAMPAPPAPPSAPAPAVAFADPGPVDVHAMESTTTLMAEQVARSRTNREATEVALMAPGTVRDGDPGDDREGPIEARIALQPWLADSPYARRLRAASADRIYRLYLDERDDHAGSTAFHLDVATLLLQRGRRAEALRVLSNLAEMDLENRHVLRVLGYRLMQAKAWPLAVQVFRQVLAMAEEEPQSHRDLGLALAAAGDRQQAAVHLYDVVAGEWDDRFEGVDVVALNELNAIVATSPTPLATRFIDSRLLRNLPLDLRVVLSWDSDNSDMDLWVTDPNGEKCYYSNRLTYQGGLISNDFTGGYGPEEFLLRNAKPGRYRVEAHYFGDRQQVVTGATTLSMTFTTGWGTSRQRDQEVTLQLTGRDESVLVGEFEVD